MRIFITGGTGFVGTHLTAALAKAGHEVEILTRSRQGRTGPKGVSYVEGDPARPGQWQSRLSEAHCIINLAGESIAQRWTDEVKHRLRDSRINTTRNIVDALPGTWNGTFFSTSAVGYYGFHGDEELDESSPHGSDFLAVVADEWEHTARLAERNGARVVITRFGVVLGDNGGVLGKLIPVFKAHIGGRVGSGQQWFSWIHVDDLVAAFLFILDKPDIRGPVNLTSPAPVRNAVFAKALGDALGVPSFVPTPGFAVRLAMGDFADVIIEGQRVVPRVLIDAGFPFGMPDIRDAVADVMRKAASK